VGVLEFCPRLLDIVWTLFFPISSFMKHPTAPFLLSLKLFSPCCLNFSLVSVGENFLPPCRKWKIFTHMVMALGQTDSILKGPDHVVKKYMRNWTSILYPIELPSSSLSLSTILHIFSVPSACIFYTFKTPLPHQRRPSGHGVSIPSVTWIAMGKTTLEHKNIANAWRGYFISLAP